MGQGARRGKVVLLLLCLALVVIAVTAWEPLYWLILTKKETGTLPNGQRFEVSYLRLNRSVRHGHHILYFANGMMHAKGLYLHGEQHDCWTWWVESGMVAKQRVLAPYKVLDERFWPPWLNGVTDQSSPSDPQWIAEHGK